MSKKLCFFILAFYLSQCAWGLDSQSAQAVLDECSAYSNAEMHACLIKKVEASTIELKKAEKMVQDKLNNWDEDAKYVIVAKSKFEASNNYFLHYRDIQCSFSMSLGGGAIGNSLNMRKLSCLYELNSQRTQNIINSTFNLTIK